MVFFPIASVFGDISVGVKKGDWIQYNANVRGTPPEDLNVKWISMNVTDVAGTTIGLDIQTLYSNGTLYPAHITLNFATGALGDDYVIPKNLNVGDQFYDKYQGNITITSTEKLDVAGAQRTVVLAATNYTHYVWDRETGVLVGATTREPDFTITTDTNSTNILQPDIAGFQPALFYPVTVMVAIAAVASAALTAVWIKQRKQRTLLLALEGVGAVFVGIFLAAYLGGMFMNPSTKVLHSEPAFRIPLLILGVVLLILTLGTAATGLRGKVQLKSASPLKIGLLIVVASYFLFTLHAMFTLQWWGEWNFSGSFNFGVFITDIAALPGLIARFIGSLIAFVAVAFGLTKKGLSQSIVHKLLKVVLVLEALYWLSLLPSGIWGILPTARGFSLAFLASTGLPCLVASITIPVSLFAIVRNLGQNKPQKAAIKWSLIAGIFYVVAFWLNNSGMWIVTVMQTGIGYVLNTPQYLVSFSATLFGLLALAIYMAYFAKKSIGTEQVKNLSFGSIGAILTALGVYYLWNYLTWIFFGGWSQWYAWILGHNLDLWLLSLPMVGLALLFYKRAANSEAKPS
jgi:hypothetical protein